MSVKMADTIEVNKEEYNTLLIRAALGAKYANDSAERLEEVKKVVDGDEEKVLLGREIYMARLVTNSEATSLAINLLNAAHDLVYSIRGLQYGVVVDNAPWPTVEPHTALKLQEAVDGLDAVYLQKGRVKIPAVGEKEIEPEPDNSQPYLLTTKVPRRNKILGMS